MQDHRDICCTCMPANLLTIVCTCIHTYIHTYIHTPPRPPVTGHGPNLPAYITFGSCDCSSATIQPCSCPPHPPVPLWPSIAHRVVSLAHYYQRETMYVCKPARIGACLYAQCKCCSIFAVSTSFASPQRPRQCFRM